MRLIALVLLHELFGHRIQRNSIVGTEGTELAEVFVAQQIRSIDGMGAAFSVRSGCRADPLPTLHFEQLQVVSRRPTLLEGLRWELFGTRGPAPNNAVEVSGVYAILQLHVVSTKATKTQQGIREESTEDKLLKAVLNVFHEIRRRFNVVRLALMASETLPLPEDLTLKEYLEGRLDVFELKRGHSASKGDDWLVSLVGGGATAIVEDDSDAEYIDQQSVEGDFTQQDKEEEQKTEAPHDEVIFQVFKDRRRDIGAEEPQLENFFPKASLDKWPKKKLLAESLVDETSQHRWWLEKPAPIPGQAGFNAFATRCMRAGLKKDDFSVEPPRSDGEPRPQPYQRTVSFLVHPFSPVQRMLVVHRTGAGKTCTMLRVLDNFFYDTRPKVVIFPTQLLVANFYLELCKFRGRYRDYVRQTCPIVKDWLKAQKQNQGVVNVKVRQSLAVSVRADNVDIKAVLAAVSQALMMPQMFHKGKLRPSKRVPDRSMPAAPLRVYSYMRAGGTTVTQGVDEGRPVNALVKVQFDTSGKNNPYTNKIVLMDEAHNLTMGTAQLANKLWRDKLNNLREYLSVAENATVLGLTATPVRSLASDADGLLQIFQGTKLLDAQAVAPVSAEAKAEQAEGFVSFFHSSPRSVFPSVYPVGAPDTVLPEIVFVDLPIGSQNRDIFVKKAQQNPDFGQRELESEHRPFSEEAVKKLTGLVNYSTMGTYAAQVKKKREALLEKPESFACKLYAVAKDVIHAWKKERGKAVIIVHRRTGFKAMAMLLEHMATTTESRSPLRVASYPPCLDSKEENELGAAGILDLFNQESNRSGTELGVLVADGQIASEGISFLAARRLYLVDVPGSWLDYVQQVGRVVRFHGHRHLGFDKWTVDVFLYVARCLEITRRCNRKGCRASSPQRHLDYLNLNHVHEDDPFFIAMADRPPYNSEMRCRGQQCQRWFCSNLHWVEGHDLHRKVLNCRTKTLSRDERLPIVTADELLLANLQRQLGENSPLSFLERCAVDREVLAVAIADPAAAGSTGEEVTLAKDAPQALARLTRQKPPGLGSCGICMDDARADLLNLTGGSCAHWFCPTCVRQSLMLVLDKGLFPAYCPGCVAAGASWKVGGSTMQDRKAATGPPELQIGLLEDLASLRVVSWVMARRFSRQITAANVKLFVCPCCGLDCDRLRFDDHRTECTPCSQNPSCEKCAHCNQHFCCKCLAPWHYKQNCEDYEMDQKRQKRELDPEAALLRKKAEARSEALLRQTSKPCPTCKVPITHYFMHGCHHIRPPIGEAGGCPNCHTHFCYVCLRQGTSCDSCGAFCDVEMRCGCPICEVCKPGKSCDQCHGCSSCKPTEYRNLDCM
eukprot:gb/GEZN01000539.1/.p1 GENE.gb/GEZN01000539.1/~~gb/GEZN01000539.1/.p1  ORF type:complete len:1342 (+),score=148.15 gb/GEZN01000539.1/:92-4117(+)